MTSVGDIRERHHHLHASRMIRGAQALWLQMCDEEDEKSALSVLLAGRWGSQELANLQVVHRASDSFFGSDGSNNPHRFFICD